MYSENDWRDYSDRNLEEFDEYSLDHSDEEYFSENDYQRYLEHRMTLKEATSRVSKAIDSAKRTVKNFTSKVRAKASKSSSRSSSGSSGSSRSSSGGSSKSSSDSKEEKRTGSGGGKWEWPDGKNSPEYNHWYYENNKDKWGVKGDGATGGSGPRTEEEWERYYELHTKGWENMTDAEKKEYMDHQNDHNRIELVISQFLQRPLSILAGDVGTYLYTAARDLMADYAYVKTGIFKAERMLSDGETDEATGFKMKNEKSMARMNDSSYKDEADDLNHVNPGYLNWDTNTKQNCMLCTTTYDLRRRGYDVTANNSTSGLYVENINDWYPDAKVNYIINTNQGEPGSVGQTPRQEQGLSANWGDEEIANSVMDSIDKFEKYVEKYPDGARGNIMVQWANNSGGHSMIWEIRDGKCVILDGQTNTVYNDPAEILMDTDGNFDFARLDDVDINPEAIKRCAKS